MTPAELERAWSEFCTVFEREKQLPGDERGLTAMRAAFRAVEANNLAEERARQIIATIALKHDTTSVDIRRTYGRYGATVNTTMAREEAAYELTRAGLGQRAVARLLGRKNQAHVREWIGRHEARMAASAAVVEAREVSHGR